MAVNYDSTRCLQSSFQEEQPETCPPKVWITQKITFVDLDFSFVNAYSVGFQAEEYWWTKGFNQPSEFIKENRVTGRLLYRKQDFDQVGGFDETLRFYEDWDRW